MGCCNNPKKEEKTDILIEFNFNEIDEPKLNLEDDNNCNLLDDVSNRKLCLSNLVMIKNEKSKTEKVI